MSEATTWYLLESIAYEGVPIGADLDPRAM